jgi:hypothetical protein
MNVALSSPDSVLIAGSAPSSGETESQVTLRLAGAEPGAELPPDWLRLSVSRAGRDEVRGELMCRGLGLSRGEVGPGTDPGWLTAVKGGDIELASLRGSRAFSARGRKAPTLPADGGAGAEARSDMREVAGAVTPAFAPAVAARGVIGGHGATGGSIGTAVRSCLLGGSTPCLGEGRLWQQQHRPPLSASSSGADDGQ